MPKDPSSQLPARQVPLDRATIERVLARAAELQATSGTSDDGEPNLSESQLIEIGNLSSITGPASATASRAVRGTPDEVLMSLDTWMQRDESLQVQRRFPDRITWEPRAGLIGMIQRGLNVGGRGYYLCRATQVAATVVPIEGGRVLVRLDADLSESRGARLKTGGVLFTGGVFGAGAAGGMAVLAHAAVFAVGGVAAIPLLIGGIAAYEVGKRHRQFVSRAQLALEQTLDRLEFGTTRRLR